jgi:hypothetical protein
MECFPGRKKARTLSIKPVGASKLVVGLNLRIMSVGTSMMLPNLSITASLAPSTILLCFLSQPPHVENPLALSYVRVENPLLNEADDSVPL